MASWPWKKKSSDKHATEKAAALLDSVSVPSDVAAPAPQAEQAKQENHKKPKFVQISVESYTHLSGLEELVKSYESEVKSYEEQVRTYEDDIKELNEKLSAADSEMTEKESLVKQHAKVAEEAVSGWEKAEAEAASLKNHLESVTLLKLTAEDRASHLDGALKECMRQIRNLKEENEQRLHEVTVSKTKQFERMKLELEAKISGLDQQLLRSAADNAALSRSLQERSNMIIKLSEEKSQAEAEIQHLRSNIESLEKEINSLKYEVHIARKEVEIRNEEKNMSVRSAEAANKQHLEGVKKIAKLEAECQRLRGLVRKKLPGPAALAQMKFEVESLGRDYAEPRLRRSPGRPPSPQLSPFPELSLDNTQKYLKENELLTERLLAMEEETKMLKEALSKRNSELQISRSICAKTANKLQSLEAQLQANNHQKNSPKSNVQILMDGLYSRNASSPPSLTSMSEDGNDDNVSCTGSWMTTSMSEYSHIKREKNVDSPHKSEKENRLDLMDDFLEMEKLACLSNDSNGSASSPNISSDCSQSENATHGTPVEVMANSDSEAQVPPNEAVAENPQMQADRPITMKLQSRISMILESMTKEKDIDKVLKDIGKVVHDMHDSLRHQSVNHVVETADNETTSGQACCQDAEIPAEKEMLEDSKTSDAAVRTITQDLEVAISQIYDFVMNLGRETKAVQGISPTGDGLIHDLEWFSTKYSGAINKETDLVEYVLDLSRILTKASELHFNVLGFKSSEVETGSSDYIDKIALPENKIVLDSSGEIYPNGCATFSDSTSDPDIHHDGNPVPISESTATSWKCSSEEFEQLKSEKENLAMDLAKCMEDLENTKSELLEAERLLTDVKSQLISSQKSNSLSETQLKCMAESYRTLETRAEELQNEVNLLHEKLESLDNELQEERRSHQDALSRCNNLQDQLQRIENSAEADNNAKHNQETELAAAAEKLAECQETIYLLGKQLNALRPQTEYMGSPNNTRSQKSENSSEEVPTISGLNSLEPAEMDTATSVTLQRAGSESPLDLYNVPFSPIDSEANDLLRSPVSSKYPKHRPTKSGSSSSSSTPTPEKPSRGFSRFFSTKGKSGQ